MLGNNSFFKLFFFLLSQFLSFSQENLEVIFEINEDGGFITNDGNFVLEYNIKNNQDIIIGSVRLSKDEKAFEYYNINRNIVFTQPNTFHSKTSKPVYGQPKDIFSPFDATPFAMIEYKRTGSYLFKQEWNLDKEQFDLCAKFVNGRYNGCRNIVGKIVQNLENGNWELYSYFENIKASDSSEEGEIFSPYFDLEKRSIRGNVTSNIEGNLPGAIVYIKGTSKGTTTDFDGNFTIEVKRDDILVVSFIKHLDKEVKIKSTRKNFYDIVLQHKRKKRKK